MQNTKIYTKYMKEYQLIRKNTLREKKKKKNVVLDLTAISNFGVIL